LNPQRFRQLLVARHRLVRIVTAEERESISLAVEAGLSMNMTPFAWTVTTGITPATMAGDTPIADTMHPAAALAHARNKLDDSTMLILLDMAEHLGEPATLRALRDLYETYASSERATSCIVMIDHKDTVPAVIGACSVRYDIAAPGDEEIGDLVKETIQMHKRERPVQATITRELFDQIVLNLRGLTRRQVRQVITTCIMDDRELNEKDLVTIQRSKRKLLEDAGVLDFVESPASLDDIGGLANMKDWLRKREALFGTKTEKPPRGLLLLGVQGAGKSLAAKAIATAWKRPLMRLDPGALYNKYVGETERNLRDALKQAEAMAPVVLWIDEIEKGFASASSTSNDGGTSRRMFGSLLTWMQEHQSHVFLVATANDIEALPPELLRKGRFDEIFFVDLPTQGVREVIFRIHLKKRGYQPELFDIARLADNSKGFSGAEIEQAIVSAHIDATFAKTSLTTVMVERVLESSPPLSVTMAEKIQWLRDWSKGRCVPAD
jgi:SpoVK/Ycf46/Vps4 family AAA+-type ATPase